MRDQVVNGRAGSDAQRRLSGCNASRYDAASRRRKDLRGSFTERKRDVDRAFVASTSTSAETVGGRLYRVASHHRSQAFMINRREFLGITAGAGATLKLLLTCSVHSSAGDAPIATEPYNAIERRNQST